MVLLLLFAFEFHLVLCGGGAAGAGARWIDGSMDRSLDRSLLSQLQSWITLGWAWCAVLWRNVPQSAKLDMTLLRHATRRSPPSSWA